MLLTGPAAALNIDLPGNVELTREVDTQADTYFLPTSPVDNGAFQSKEIEGHVIRQAWRIEGEQISTLGLLGAIREQMQSQGYQILLDCTATECGGFDFRFGIEVLPAPQMFVDLFDFRFLSAQNPKVSGAQYVSALVSRAGEVGYVQLVRVGSDGSAVIDSPAPEPVKQPDPQLISLDTSETEGVAAFLVKHGHVILSDLVFATGSSSLESGDYVSLRELAKFLNEAPEREVVLVGHTDAVGAMDDNVALSRERAASVLERLIQDYGVNPDQLSSNGMGFLSPVAPNATDEGRRANRRVEAVLLNAR